MALAAFLAICGMAATLTLWQPPAVDLPTVTAITGNGLTITATSELADGTPLVAGTVDARAELAQAARALGPIRPHSLGAHTHLDLFFVPHQDDEVLAMGAEIVQRVTAGDTVVLVNYTDGSDTQVCRATTSGVCSATVGTACLPGTDCQAKSYAGVPVADFVADRTRELVGSAVALGVSPDHVVTGQVIPPLPGGFPGEARAKDGGVTAAFAARVVWYYAHAYAASSVDYYAMSWIDAHPDHRLMGLALRGAVSAGLVPAANAHFLMFRPYWQTSYPGPLPAKLLERRTSLRVVFGPPTSAALVQCVDTEVAPGRMMSGAACRDSVDRALLSYRYPYDIGYRSVKEYLDVQAQDPLKTALIHGPGTTAYPSTIDVHGVLDLQIPVISGSCSVVGDGPFPAGLDDPTALADSISGVQATAVMYLGGFMTSVTTGVDGSPLALRVPIKHGRWSTEIPDAQSSAPLFLSCPGRLGVAPSRVRTTAHALFGDRSFSRVFGNAAVAP